jgi:CDGSH-type Zn-finger protein
MSERPSIECKPDGPYLVKGVEDLRDAQGNAIAAKAVMALCRCGGSAKKPFCDGTHQKNGFSGARLADGRADRRANYKAGPITIHDNRSICAHAGHCTDGLAAVFRYKKEPWIDPAGAEVQEIIDTIRKCPSGALSFSLDDVEIFDEPRAAAITATKDGPYAVAGDVELPGQSWAKGAPRSRYTLCRCGASKNKPFCDGSHWGAGFKDGGG